MKISTRILITCLMCLTFTTVSIQKVNACVDQALTVTITCHYDTVNFTDIALLVSNLRLFGGTPNDFCSCAITNYTDLFTNISYVAFVDSGTTTPVAGFDPYVANANASAAWESVLATGDWQGFVSDVNGNGLTPGAPVELVIRASLPLGYTFSLLDSNVVASQLGTDEWDNINQDLANSHQNVLALWDFTFVAEHANSTYFTDLDNAVLTGIETHATEKFRIYPVPSAEEIYIQLNQTEFSLVSIYSVSGQLINSLNLSEYKGEEFTLDIRDFPAGIYHLLFNSPSGFISEKFVKE